MLVPTLAALLASALPTTPTVEFENARFLDEDGNLTLLTSSASVPYGVPGVILAEFDFTSDLTHPRTGQYVAPPIGVLWRISDGNGRVRTSITDGEWIGLTRRIDELFVQEFDPITGLGSAALEIPIGTTLADESYHYADFWEGSSTIDIVIGHADLLDVDANGAPTNVFAYGQIDVAQVDMPEAIVKLLSPFSALTEEVRAFVVLDELLAATETLVVTAVPAERVEILNDTLLFEPDTRGVAVDYVGLESGTFHLEVWRGGERIATSHRGTIGEPEMLFSTIAGGGGTIPSTGVNPTGGSIANPARPNYSNWKDCKPAQSVGGAGFITCGKCKKIPEAPSCASTAYQMQPAYCFFNPFATCVQATNNVTSAAYDFDGFSIVPCGSLSGSGKLKIGPDGVVEVEVGGTLNLSRVCCTYKINTSAPNVTVAWVGCN